MNKNVIITALLIAVSCQSVSAALPVPVSMMSKVTAFVGSHKAALGVTVASSALLVAAYKYFTREKVWTEGNCIKFRKRTPFCREEGFVRFKTSGEATAAYQVFKKGNVLGGFPRIQEVAKTQRTHPSFEWSPTPMTPAEAQKFDKDMARTLKEHARIMKEAFGEFGW